MKPFQRFTLDPDSLEFVPMQVHPYGYAMWWLADNVKQIWHWMKHGKYLHSDYLRFESEKKSDIHRRLTLRWNLKTKLGR